MKKQENWINGKKTKKKNERWEGHEEMLLIKKKKKLLRKLVRSFLLFELFSTQRTWVEKTI